MKIDFFLILAGLTGKVCPVGRVGFSGFPGRIGAGQARVITGWMGRVGSSTSFSQFCLPVPVLDPPVLTGHGSDGFEHGAGHGHRSDLSRTGYFNTLVCNFAVTHS
jgi:hypothetical protein